MSGLDHNCEATRADFERSFDSIALAMKKAVRAENYLVASSEAERYGLTQVPPSKPVGEAWQASANGLTIWFQWRYYDQSKPFSNQKDMNIMSLELHDNEAVLRKAEERFED